MSTINAQNYGDGTDSVPASAVLQGTAKAWVNFNGTGTVAIRESFNVASLTDLGTGRYSFSRSNAFSNSNYSSTFGVIRQDNSSTESSGNMSFQSLSSYQASSMRVSVYDNDTNAYRDAVMVNVVSSGDLA